jgi:hypothetical protein
MTSSSPTTIEPTSEEVDETYLTVLSSFHTRLTDTADSFSSLMGLLESFSPTLSLISHQFHSPSPLDFDSLSSILSDQFFHSSSNDSTELKALFSSIVDARFPHKLSSPSSHLNPFLSYFVDFLLSLQKLCTREMILSRLEIETRAQFDQSLIDRQTPLPELVCATPNASVLPRLLSSTFRELSHIAATVIPSLSSFDAEFAEFELLPPQLLLSAFSQYRRLAETLCENLESIRDLKRENERLLSIIEKPQRFQEGLAVRMTERFLEEKLDLWKQCVQENEKRREVYVKEIDGTKMNERILQEEIEIEKGVRKRGDCCCLDREFVFGTCGHSFCGDCFERVMSEGKLKCPYFECPFMESDIIRIQWTFNEYDERQFESENVIFGDCYEPVMRLYIKTLSYGKCDE